MKATLMTPKRSLLLAAVAALAAGCSQGGGHLPLAAGAPAQITVPGEQIFPESLTSTRDGSVIVGSIGTHQIFKVAPHGTAAAPFIAPGTDGLLSVLGVFADDASNTLYACSDNQAPGASPDGVLYAFDLTTGAPQGHHALPGKSAFCNDIAVGADGTIYATDTNNMQIVRLKKGAADLEVWAGNGAFGPASGALDGIAVLGSRVVVSLIGTGQFFSVPVQADGSAGAVTPVTLSRRIGAPDGIRAVSPDTLLVAEGGFSGLLRSTLETLQGGKGALDEVKLSGDSGTVTTLRRGFPDGPVSVTVVGTTAYLLEGQLSGYYRAAGTPPPPARPFTATAVEVGALEPKQDAGKL